MPILGYHFIFSAYGFWLPNDPRGSWSETVREFELHKFGPATKVQTTRSVAARPHDDKLRLAAKKSLRYPPVRLTGQQAVLIAKGYADAQAQHAYVIHALAILHDHVHLVMLNHGNDIDKIAAHLKAKATSRLNAHGAHPLAEHISPQAEFPRPGRGIIGALLFSTNNITSKRLPTSKRIRSKRDCARSAGALSLPIPATSRGANYLPRHSLP